MAQPTFELDKQTRQDLSIFPDNNGGMSILGIFDHAVTIGGKEKLRDIFNAPLTDAVQIARRIAAIKYLSHTNINFQPDKGACDYIEFYLKLGQKPTSVSKIKAVERKVLNFFTTDSEYYTITQGITYTLGFLSELNNLIADTDVNSLPALLQDFHRTINDILRNPDLGFIYPLTGKKKLTAIDIAKADHLFRHTAHDRIKTMLDMVYQLDVFITAAKLSKTLGFGFPVIITQGPQVLKLDGVFHPFVSNAIDNNIAFSNTKNICFVTGANMAGKSTFLKSVGICVFLSQLGFPVPAANMETSVFEGLITTINLSDNINQGNSHFYTEVSRVKHVANSMRQSQNIVVIFDELFRGTNVKDAFDASLSIISAFSKLKQGIFIVSTHIVEVAHELIAIKNIDFKFMESTFDNDIPKYSYKLMDGITEERLGMWIVKNEGIVEIIEEIINRG